MKFEEFWINNGVLYCQIKSHIFVLFRVLIYHNIICVSYSMYHIVCVTQWKLEIESQPMNLDQNNCLFFTPT